MQIANRVKVTVEEIYPQNIHYQPRFTMSILLL